MVFLNPVRSAIPPEARKRAYDIATAIIAGLGMWGYLDASEIQQWTSLAVSFIALVFAILYAQTTARAALYTFLVAVASIAGAYGILTESQSAGLLSVAVAVLGVAVAGSNTPKQEVPSP